MAFGNTVSADIGEKPSIRVTVENPPAGDYYIALLSGDHVDAPLPETAPEAFDPGKTEVEEYLENFDHAGLYWFRSPVGYNVWPSYDDHIYLFDYSVPRDFRVILISEDGSVEISEPCTRKEYNAEVTYDHLTGSLTEHREKKIRTNILKLLGYYVLTLILEGLMLAAFEFPLSKKNILHLLIVNALTNIPLNIYLSTFSTLLSKAVSAFVPEMLICLAEGIYYYHALEDKEGNTCLAKSFWYGIIGNIVSAVAGPLLIVLFYLLFFVVYRMFM